MTEYAEKLKAEKFRIFNSKKRQIEELLNELQELIDPCFDLYVNRSSTIWKDKFSLQTSNSSGTWTTFEK